MTAEAGKALPTSRPWTPQGYPGQRMRRAAFAPTSPSFKKTAESRWLRALADREKAGRARANGASSAAKKDPREGRKESKREFAIPPDGSALFLRVWWPGEGPKSWSRPLLACSTRSRTYHDRQLVSVVGGSFDSEEKEAKSPLIPPTSSLSSFLDWNRRSLHDHYE